MMAGTGSARRALLAGLAALLVGACSDTRGGETPPHHVLFVLIDTLRAKHLSCYGYARRTSPHIDRLAWKGVRFERCTAQSSWTGPSMVSMFTGQYLADERLSIPEKSPTMPELFREAGYRTGAFVVNPILHNGSNGFRRGFDTFETKAGWRRISDWIASHAGERTFTYVHWVDPHDPYGPEEAYHHFMREGGELPAELDDYYTTATRILRLQFARASREKIAAAIDGYDDDIRLVDSKVDTLVGALRDADILGRSVVVIASDHGEGLWKRPNYGQIAEENPVGTEEGDPKGGPDDPKVQTILSTHKMTHGNQLFEELIHVPLIFHAPAFATNVVVAQPVENVDILPTLLDMAGIPAPPRLGGRSLLPLMRGEEVEPDPTSGVSVTRWFRTIRSADGLKVIAPTTAGLEAGLAVEAYDLIHDPHERTNLFSARSDASVELMLRLDEELAGSLPGEDGISDANLEALRALGYTE